MVEVVETKGGKMSDFMEIVGREPMVGWSGLCPNCGYKQECGCESCLENLPPKGNPYISVSGDGHQCANCGFTMHVDGWGEWEIECYALDEKFGQIK